MSPDAGFHVEPADWSTDRDALRAIREAVFIREQQVPIEEEWDDLDPDCRHVLARDTAGRAIGTGRLTPLRSIGRMAVLADWRGRGVGAALLQALVDQARALRWECVSLNAQVQAIGFYQRFGFRAEGDTFMEAGIEHRTMSRTLEPFASPPGERGTPRIQPEYRVLETETRDDLVAAVAQLLADARHAVIIHHRDLAPGVLDHENVLAGLRRLATSGRGAELRLLLGDPDKLLRDGHRLVPLAQRLTSTIHLRVPIEEADMAYPSAFLANDVGGYLMLPLAERHEGRGATCNPGKNRELMRYFDEVWERAAPATVLRSLGL
jgi:predicted GNAT family N-acyltransferase